VVVCSVRHNLQPLQTTAAALANFDSEDMDDLIAELYAESATLWAEHGVALQEGVRDVGRLIRAHRLAVAAAALDFVERTVEKAAASERDAQEKAWLATISSHLGAIRQRAAEVLTALHEFRENSTVGWRRGYSSDGILTEWSAAQDGSLWIRMTGELEGAELAHVVAVAYEVELWPTWVPLCAGAELLQTLGPMERISWTQFELSMMKRSASLHWSLSDCFAEGRCLLLLGASIEEDSSQFELPAAANGSTVADFRAIKVLLRPRTPTSAQIRWLVNVDLKAKLPQTLISMVTKKVAGAILSLLVREAQKVSAASHKEGTTGTAVDTKANAYLRRMEQRQAFYNSVRALVTKYFDIFGEDGGQ